ncbi:hypothetical protein L1987_48790 [Smallanthus sonchifolius]|uniref:Uncharacterized protein n=1 Tax=Smallanthus sonchifolius TaxID=185202 RepID=A0ACB9FTZ3_9ASTR|nr:hypothetical protein L1987_48790 [Smallanthus sonchifolius]
MAQSNGFEDIGSINRPPILVSGEDYVMWKNRMESFFCYQEYGMWKSIRDGPYIPMVASADSRGPSVPKEPSKYSEEDIKKMEKLQNRQRALEALEKMFAGSEEVKENIRDILKQQYENFVWKEGESLTVLYNRYTYLVRELQCSKVKLENEDILKKFIRSLPSCWTLYTVSIRRTENLKTLQMTELFGMLKTYELEMIQAKERSSSYQTASTSTTTSSAFHSEHSGPSTSNYYPPIVTHPQTPTSKTNTSPFLLEAPSQASTSAAFVSENSSNMYFIKEDLECFHPDDLEEMDIHHSYAMLSIRAKRFYSRTGRPIPSNSSNTRVGLDKTQTAACAAVGTSDFDWSFQYEGLPTNNQALMADTTEIPPQIDDLLARLKATRAELAEQKVHVDKYEFASKKLQRLLDAQIHEKVKTGLVYHAEQYQAIAPPADYVAIHEPSFNLANLDMANKNPDPSKDEPLVQECTTSSESESTCSDSSETSKASSPPAPQVILTKDEVPIIHSAPVPAISVPHMLHYLQQQKNLKQHAFEKTKKNKQVRRFEAKTTQYRNSLSPSREQLSKPLQSCIICGESDHFAANCKFNHFNQILLPPQIMQKPISKVKTDKHKPVLKPSAANKTAADRVKPKQSKGRPSAAKSGAAQVKPSAATKSASDQSKPSNAASTAEKAKRAGKSPTQQWKEKKPPSIIIGSVECVYPLLNKFPADNFKAVSSNSLAADHCIHQQQLSLLLTDLIFRIHSNQFALTTNPTIYIPHMEDFWSTVVYSTEQGIPQIKAKVDGKDITILEATLRKHLKLQDEGAAISYSKDEYMRTFVSIGYTGNQTEYTIEKVLRGPPWKYLCHTLLQCISQKRSGWHQVSSALASAFHGFNVPLLSTMLNIHSTPGDSSAIPADTDPTPSTQHPEQQSASTIRTPVDTTKDAQAQTLLTLVLDVIVQPEHRAPVATTYTRKWGKRTPSSLASKAQTQPNSPHSESQHSGENIIRESHIIRVTPLDVSLLGSGSLPGSIEQPPEPFLSLLNLSVEEPDQDDVPSPTTTISEWMWKRLTIAGPSNNQEDSDNMAKTSTTANHYEDASLETPLTERNPWCQETMGDGDEEARPKAPSGSKDSTTVDEDRLKLHNLELTARVAMLEAEVSKLRHQVSMHEAHQCPTVPSPSLVLVGTQTVAYLSTDATKKGEMVPMEEDSDSLDDWIQEQAVFQNTLFKPAFVQVHDLPASDNEEEETTEDCSHHKSLHYPQFPPTSTQLEFDTILAWGYDGKSERFWIGWEFSGVEELNWDFLNIIQFLHLYHLHCINNSTDLSAVLAIGRFYDLMEDNLPNFQRQMQAAKRVAYPESSTAAERRLTPRRLEIIRRSLLAEEEVLCLRRFLYNSIVKDLDVLGWVSTKSLDHTFLLGNDSSLTINTRNILLLPTDFLYMIFQLRANICNVNSLESHAMMATVKAHLEQKGRIAEEVYVSNSDTDSDSASTRVDIFAAAYESRSTVKEMLIELTSPECKTDEANDLPISTSQIANEAEAEIPTAAQSSAVVISEAEAEASNKEKGKGIITEEDEERLQREKKEKEERRRRRREEEEMAETKKAQDRITVILLREQQIQLYAKQLDALKVKIPAVYQIEEDEALALQLQEQFDKEEEEIEKKKKEEAKFRITDSELAKEMIEEWVKALVSQGEDADYLEKLSNKEIYRAFMGQQGQLAKKKQAEEEEKAKHKSKKTIAFNKRTHEERKVMIDFLKARGESGKRLGSINFMNLQALYVKFKKDEEEILEKKGSKKRVNIQEEERKSEKPNTSSIQQPSTLLPKPPSSHPSKSKSTHPAPTHQQPPKKKNKPTSKPEDSREIIRWSYSPEDQWFEVFRGRTEAKRSIYTSVDEVLQLPDSDPRRMIELGESSEPENEGGRHLLLEIRHYFNPSKDEIIDAKPLQSHTPFISWSYNAENNEFTLIDVKGQKMRCSSKAIFKMASKDIKTLSELPLNNPSKEQKGYEVERIVSNMQKLQQQRQ